MKLPGVIVLLLSNKEEHISSEIKWKPLPHQPSIIVENCLKKKSVVGSICGKDILDLMLFSCFAKE